MIPLFITSSYHFLFNKNTKAWWIGLIIVLIVLAIIAFCWWLIAIGQGWWLLLAIPVILLAGAMLE